jgi:hypothetical protein
VEAQEVEAIGQVRYSRLLIRQGKASWREPDGQLHLGVVRILLRFAEDDEVVRVADQTTLADIVAASDVFHADCSFHAVQGDVGEQRADDSGATEHQC